MACQFGEMCECEYVCEERGLHSETGAKLDSETSQIVREMKQTTPEEKKKATRQNKTTHGPRKSVEQGRLAQKQKKKKEKQNKTNTLFFLLDIFQPADDKTTVRELEESKSNR